MGICEHRTVIVTGSGSGLGREYVLQLAEQGANVVVNDIRADAAMAVAGQIGQQAIANSDDITRVDGAASIVDAAVSAFGDVHAVINNAGVVRDRMFVNMTEDEWDLVVKIHLKGHFCLASKLAQRWRDQVKATGVKVDARIINTTSASGLWGSLGQGNYAAAKAGIAALTLVQAQELARYGITSNALAPLARTGMTETVLASMMQKPDAAETFDHYHPGNVAPLVAWLCSTRSANVTGRVFEVSGGKLSIAQGWRSGAVQDKNARWDPAELTDVVESLIAEAPPAQKLAGA